MDRCGLDLGGSGRSAARSSLDRAPEGRGRPWDGGACVTLRDAVRQVTGSEPAPYGGHLASDIRFPIRLLGAAEVGVGSLAGNFYGPDEWVDVDDLVRLVAVTVVFGNEWTR